MVVQVLRQVARSQTSRPFESNSADRQKGSLCRRMIVTRAGAALAEVLDEEEQNRQGPWLPDVDPSIALVQAIRNEPKHRALMIGWDHVLASLLTLSLLLLSATKSLSQVACKPLLSISDVREVRSSFMPTIPWTWNATIIADIHHCATRSGTFEIDFVRSKENSPDLQFTEKFRWSQSQFGVSIELTADEAIRDFRIGFIAPCVCRDIDKLSIAPPQPMTFGSKCPTRIYAFSTRP